MDKWQGQEALLNFIFDYRQRQNIKYIWVNVYPKISDYSFGKKPCYNEQ